ncbi:MAG TPA: hypothetical protein VGS98_04095 [Thermoanaerobaculia bacterium]|nr:hypothetical protein [Thermoanaerobaculia bacterium]
MTTRVAILGAALLAATLPLTAQKGSSANQPYELSAMLSGMWEGSTPGNELRLQIRSATTDPSHLYDLYVQVAGKYQGENVRQQGLIRLESQGKSVYFGYIPHFDPTVSALSTNVARFTDEEANAACGLVMDPKGDGFAGETVGSTCARAIRGAIGKWTIEVDPATIRIRNVKTGETLRFKKVSK